MLAEMLAYSVGSKLDPEDIQSVEEAIRGGGYSRDLSHIVIYNPQNQIVASYDFEDGKWAFKAEGIKKTKPFIDPEIVKVFKPITSSNEKIGYLAIGMSMSDVKKEISKNKRITYLVSFFLFIFGILIANYLSDTLSKPIIRLTDAVRRLSKGDIQVEIVAEGRDELGTLAKVFNQMTGELRRSRETIIQQEKLASVGQLASGIAHELNNPLGGILGFSQYALEKISKKSTKDLTRDDISAYIQYLKDIEYQSQRCKTIVQNLLKFARCSTKAEFEPMDLNSVLNETLKVFSHQIEISKVKLITNLTDSLPEVMGNSIQLQQVFTNVILNAIQAMPHGGILIVTTKELKQTEKFLRRLEITFMDTGCGIPKEYLNKIFEPFFTTKEIGKGTGLGLSVSYGIIKDHGGEIKVQSEEGKGSKFTILIPVLEKKKKSIEAREKEILKSL